MDISQNNDSRMPRPEGGNTSISRDSAVKHWGNQWENVVYTIMFISTSILFNACSVYQPPQLSADQMAVLTFPEWHIGDFIELQRVDGKPLTTFSAFGLSSYDDPITLAPGKHTIRVRMTFAGHRATFNLWLVAEPGKTYKLMKAEQRFRFSMWIVDIASGKPASGAVGSKDEPA